MADPEEFGMLEMLAHRRRWFHPARCSAVSLEPRAPGATLRAKSLFGEDRHNLTSTITSIGSSNGHFTDIISTPHLYLHAQG